MKNVLLRGPFLTLSGYGVHSRQIARWALGKKDWNVTFQVTPWGMTPWYLNEDSESGLIGEIMNRTSALNNIPPKYFDLTVQVQLPNEWDANLGKVNVGVSAVVETDRCNPMWLQDCNKMSKVIVPSTFTKRVLENTGQINTPVEVVPESYYDELLDDSIEPLAHDFSTDFNFLVFGQLTGNNPENDRKNLFYTVKWLCEEFKDNPDVGIILKTNSGKATKIDRLVTQKFVRDLIKNVRQGPFPKIHMLHGKMTNSDMVSLYKNKTVKALVSLTRGEGYGLPILEAAVAGVPVIATNWSGHIDFLRKGKFIPVDYNMTNIHPSRIDNQIFMQGARWANPVEKDAKRKIKKFYQKPNTPKKWAEDLSKKLKESLSQDKIESLYDLHIGQLL